MIFRKIAHAKEYICMSTISIFVSMTRVSEKIHWNYIEFNPCRKYSLRDSRRVGFILPSTTVASVCCYILLHRTRRCDSIESVRASIVVLTRAVDDGVPTGAAAKPCVRVDVFSVVYLGHGRWIVRSLNAGKRNARPCARLLQKNACTRGGACMRKSCHVPSSIVPIS